MDLRKAVDMINESWSNLGFSDDVRRDKAIMTSVINHPAYEDYDLEMEIIMYENAARHVTLTIGEIPNHYVDRAYESINKFNKKNAWLKSYIDVKNGTSRLNLLCSVVGYSSLPTDEVVSSIFVIGNLMLDDETARTMLDILEGKRI